MGELFPKLGQNHRKQGWQGRHERELKRLGRLNYFPDLDEK